MRQLVPLRLGQRARPRVPRPGGAVHVYPWLSKCLVSTLEPIESTKNRFKVCLKMQLVPLHLGDGEADPQADADHGHR